MTDAVAIPPTDSPPTVTPPIDIPSTEPRPAGVSAVDDTARSTRPLAVVTGGSSGIGYELARQFLDHGFDVVIAADLGAEEAASSLAAEGGEVVPFVCDLATADGVEALHRRLTALDRPVEALALNAGVGVGGALHDTALEDHLRLVALNVTSTVHLAKLVIDDMVTRGRGRVLITASVASTMPGPYYATYAASKAFVLSFAEGIRLELADSGVSVTALMPGPTDTEFFHRAGMEGTKADEGAKDDPADVARDGFDALMAGDDHVVAGSISNELQVIGGRLLSMETQAKMHARLTEPGSGAD